MTTKPSRGVTVQTKYHAVLLGALASTVVVLLRPACTLRLGTRGPLRSGSMVACQARALAIIMARRAASMAIS